MLGGSKAELETLLALMKLKDTKNDASKLMLLCPNHSLFFNLKKNVYIKVHDMVIFIYMPM